MAQGSFAATVRGWVAEKKERMAAVHFTAVERTIEFMQTPVAKGGNMPVKSGFLRASLKASIGPANFTTVANPNPEATYSANDGDITLLIAGADLSDTIDAVYTAAYARKANYGGANRAPRLFVDLAAQRWPQTVDNAAREAEARNSR